MFFKSDNEYQVMIKTINREVNRQVKVLTGGLSSVDFVNNYSTGGSSAPFGDGSSGTGDGLSGFVYGNTSVPPGTGVEVTRDRLIGAGIVYLVDDEANDQIQIQVSLINSPMFYIGM